MILAFFLLELRFILFDWFNLGQCIFFLLRIGGIYTRGQIRRLDWNKADIFPYPLATIYDLKLASTTLCLASQANVHRGSSCEKKENTGSSSCPQWTDVSEPACRKFLKCEFRQVWLNREEGKEKQSVVYWILSVV